MRSRDLYVLMIAAFAAAPLSAASAGSPFNKGSDTGRASGGTAAMIATRRAGHFTCSMNEVRTKLERKNCGERRF